MASLQKRADSFCCQFYYGNRRHTLTIGEVTLGEARQWKARIDHLLMRIRQRMLIVPPGVPITEFLLSDGKQSAPMEPPCQTTLHELREAYIKTHGNGAIESSTLATCRIHLTHAEETLGKNFLVCGLTLAKLQDHIDRRQAGVSPITIKKELDTLRATFNWGGRMGLVKGSWPGKGLVYRKCEEKLPYMPWEEIERRIKAGGDPDVLWDCLYLDTKQIDELLAFAKRWQVRDYSYPMLVMAAHTGARRSEMMRARTEDVDLEAGFITLREKKRKHGTSTTRRVPISKLLAEVLAPIVAQQRIYLFGDGFVELTDGQVHKAFLTLVKDSKWEVLKGYHILRHGFISALASKGIDQRIIDELVSHNTEQQRRRYRHLFKEVTVNAVKKVFG